MACLSIPLPEFPTLPSPITIGIAVNLDIALNANLCCKLLNFSASIALPFSVPLNPAIIATINGYITSINAYHDALSFDCPLE